MVQAARGLLSAVTRVLLLADMIVVKQIISIKKKVTSLLDFVRRKKIPLLFNVGHVDFKSIRISLVIL